MPRRGWPGRARGAGRRPGRRLRTLSPAVVLPLPPASAARRLLPAVPGRASGMARIRPPGNTAAPPGIYPVANPERAGLPSSVSGRAEIRLTGSRSRAAGYQPKKSLGISAETIYSGNHEERHARRPRGAGRCTRMNLPGPPPGGASRFCGASPVVATSRPRWHPCSRTARTEAAPGLHPTGGFVVPGPISTLSPLHYERHMGVRQRRRPVSKTGVCRFESCRPCECPFAPFSRRRTGTIL